MRITTTSESRLERLVGYVRDTVGDLEPNVDRRTPMWRAIVGQRLYGVPPGPDEPTTEARAAVDKVTGKFEERWLDEPVPALSNLTPREARDHPTERHALMVLATSRRKHNANRHTAIQRPTITVPPLQAKLADPRPSCRNAILDAIDRLHDGTEISQILRLGSGDRESANGGLVRQADGLLGEHLALRSMERHSEQRSVWRWA